MSDISKQIKKRARLKEKEEIVKFFSTGCTVLDLALGGGFAQGRMINIIGDKSSGKTLITTEMLVSNKIEDNDLILIYDDAEAGFNFDTNKMYGIAIFDEEYPHSTTIEDFDLNFNREIEKLKESQKMIYVLDSFDAIGSQAEEDKAEENRKKREEGKKEKGDYGMTKQKKSGEFFRYQIKEIRKSFSSLVIISQVRENIGVMFGAKYSRSGGKALDFYASQILWLAECEKISKNDFPIGIRTKVKVTKNKVGKPFRECFIDILFDYGIDNISSNINYLYDLLDSKGKIKSKREKIKWDELEYTRKSLITYIEENNLEEELSKKVIQKWNNFEDSIAPTDRKKKY